MKKILSVITAFITAFSFALTASALAAPDDFVKLIEDSVEGRRKEIDISAIARKNGWKGNDFFEYYETVFFSHPEYFYVDLGLKYTLTWDGIPSRIYLDYIMPEKQAEAVRRQIDEICEEIVSGITDDMSDVMKCLYVHDYIILNCEYDTTYEKHVISDCLIDRNCVCQGYTLAYMYILNNYLGIECSAVFTDEHIWNYVNIDGNWYHVDLTFDDPLTGYMDETYDMYGHVSHINFMMSDELCRMTSSDHSRWTVVGDLPAADDTSFDDAFWRDCTSRICMTGGRYYYTLDAGINTDDLRVVKLFSYDPEKNRSTFETQIAANWYRRRQTGKNGYRYGEMPYSSVYCSIEANGSKIYLNSDKKIFTYDTETRKLKESYTLKKGETKQIFGITLKDGKLTIAYKDDLSYPDEYTDLKI